MKTLHPTLIIDKRTLKWHSCYTCTYLVLVQLLLINCIFSSRIHVMIIAKNVQPFFIYVSGIDGRTLFHICMQLHEDLQTVQDGIPWPPRAKDFLCSQSLQACNPPPLQFCCMDCWNNQQLSPRVWHEKNIKCSCDIFQLAYMELNGLVQRDIPAV